MAPDRIWLFGPIEDTKQCLTASSVHSPSSPLLFSTLELLHKLQSSLQELSGLCLRSLDLRRATIGAAGSG